MVNHPNRGKDVDRPGRTPRPEEILAIRTALHLTQTGAAHLIYVSLRAWQQWEGGERKMHPAFWELFRRKTRVKVPVAAPSVAPSEPVSETGKGEP